MYKYWEHELISAIYAYTGSFFLTISKMRTGSISRRFTLSSVLSTQHFLLWLPVYQRYIDIPISLYRPDELFACC